MNYIILILLSPVVFCDQRSTNPNDEPFLPIHPVYPYNPKLMKRGLEQAQQQQQQQHQHQQPQQLTQITPELYAPKVDARDSFTAGYGQNSYYPYDSFAKSATTQAALSNSPLYQSALSSYASASPYGSFLNSYNAGPYTPPNAAYGSQSPSNLNSASGVGINPALAAAPGLPSVTGLSSATTLGAGTSLGVGPGLGGPYPYGAPGAYPYQFFQPPYPGYPGYPNYYNQPPYPPPPGYFGKHSQEYEEDDEDDRRREKSKKHHKSKSRVNSDRDSNYIDGANYLISTDKDLDGESSSHRSPSRFNQLEQESEQQPRTIVLPKATYRLISITGQQPPSAAQDNGPAPPGYIKIQQLEQLMRQALARLLTQNAVQQANLAQLQQEAIQQQQNNKENQQYVPSAIGKTGLGYVVNPTILNRVNPPHYSPSTLSQTFNGNNKQNYGQKTSTSVSVQQSSGVYIPPSKNNGDQSNDYGDYDSPESATPRNPSSPSDYQVTAEPTHNSYPYSTYRPTQATSLEDVNFGSKQKTKN